MLRQFPDLFELFWNLPKLLGPSDPSIFWRSLTVIWRLVVAGIFIYFFVTIVYYQLHLLEGE